MRAGLVLKPYPGAIGSGGVAYDIIMVCSRRYNAPSVAYHILIHHGSSSVTSTVWWASAHRYCFVASCDLLFYTSAG